MPNTKRKTELVRLALDDITTVKRFQREKSLTSFGKAFSLMLEERDSAYIAKLRNENIELKAGKRELGRKLREEEDRCSSLAIENNRLDHDIKDKDEAIKSIHEVTNKLFQENRDFRLKLELQPLGDTVEDAILQFERPEQKPLAFNGMTTENLTSKVDSIREVIDNVIMLLTEDYNRLSEGMAVPT